MNLADPTDSGAGEPAQCLQVARYAMKARREDGTYREHQRMGIERIVGAL